MKLALLFVKLKTKNYCRCSDQKGSQELLEIVFFSRHESSMQELRSTSDTSRKASTFYKAANAPAA